MAAPSKTYTFTNNESVGRAPFHNQNHDDWVDALTDGTADLVVGTVTAGGKVLGVGAFPEYDQTEVTVSDGQVTQIVYKLSGATVVTETITYNAYGNIATTVYTGEKTGTWTYSYSATDNQTLTGVVKS